MKIYVMRHGTTVWNEKGIIQGYSQNRLSKNGIREVDVIAEKYKDCRFDVIYTSPLMRTMQTTNKMNKFHKVKVIKDRRLIEVNKGIFAKRYKSSLSAKEKELRNNRHPSTGIESWNSVYSRIIEFLNCFKEKNYNNVLIVTHAWNAKFISDILSGVKIDFENLKESNYKNAEIRCFEI